MKASLHAQTKTRLPRAVAPEEATASAPVLARSGDVAGLQRAAAGCRACDLWRNATQTVFGEGPRKAKIMFVGEQPGDQEDRTGHPFVGPAGSLLDKALAEAEGLTDVRIVEAIYQSAKSNAPVKLGTLGGKERPDKGQEIHRPGHGKPGH